MKDTLKALLNELTPSDFVKVTSLYRSINGIKGDTVDEFVSNVPDRTVKGIINLCNKQLGK